MRNSATIGGLLFFSFLASAPQAAHADVSIIRTSPPSYHAPTLTSEEQQWLREKEMSLSKKLPDTKQRQELLNAVYYEAQRAGLEPDLVLAIIETESQFHQYAISPKGARGYMQVMTFWTKKEGNTTPNLFHLHTNLRYGCTIFRYYLTTAKGDIPLALAHYNGAKTPNRYSQQVQLAWQHYYVPQRLASNTANALF